jgi:hypothetical protein
MNNVEPPLDALALGRQQTAKPETVVADRAWVMRRFDSFGGTKATTALSGDCR